ncbi:MAG: ComF family protein [Clostridia bacterium]|nr:ComF family protein [Clostridia bacterium]
MKIFEKILSVVLPHKCTFCRKAIEYTNNTFICKSCADTLPFIKGRKCIKCGIPIDDNAMPVCSVCRRYKHSFTQGFIPLVYKDSVRKSLLSLKFYKRKSACRAFSYLILNRIIEEGFPTFDFVTYIPVSKERLKERGFNQAELIAKMCAEHLNLPVIPTLYRVDDTPRQSKLSMRLRRQNAKKSFMPLDVKLNGSALLIDDVYTTGSTLSHTSNLLLKLGCSKVYIAAVAISSKN